MADLHKSVTGIVTADGETLIMPIYLRKDEYGELIWPLQLTFKGRLFDFVKFSGSRGLYKEDSNTDIGVNEANPETVEDLLKQIEESEEQIFLLQDMVKHLATHIATSEGHADYQLVIDRELNVLNLTRK